MSNTTIKLLIEIFYIIIIIYWVWEKILLFIFITKLKNFNLKFNN